MRRLHKFAVATLILLGCLALSQSAQAGGWGPDFTVSDPAASGASVNFPTVLSRDDGGFIYVWSDTSISNSGIKSRVREPDGTLGPIRTVFASPYLARPIFMAAGGSDGHFRLVYVVQSQTCAACAYRYQLLATALGDDGQVSGETQTLDQFGIGVDFPDSGDSIGSAVASFADDGSALVAWEHNDSSAISLGLANATGDGDFSTQLKAPGTDNYSRPTVVASNGGGGFVSFAGGTGSGALNGMMVSPDGATTEPESMAAGAPVLSPRAVIDSTGKATVVFLENNGEFGLFMRQMGSDGNPIGAGETFLGSPGDQPSYSPGSLVLGPDDSVGVGWSIFEGDPDFVNVAQAVKIAADGTLGTVQTVSEDGVDASEPQIAFTDDGPVAFISLRSAALSARLVQAQPLGSGFARDGAPETLATYSDSDSAYLSPPVVNDSGDISMGWASQIEDAGYGIQFDAAVYDNTGPGLNPWVPPVVTKGFATVMAADAADPSGPVTLAWDFGDGGTAAGGIVTHAWNASGNVQVKVTATDSAGNETVKTVPVQVVDPPDSNPGNPVIPPDTSITGKPAKKTKAKTASFKFLSSLTGSKFECRLDKTGWVDCKSPKKLKKLKPGKHTFRVRAVKGDLVDSSPASYSWTVKKAKKKKHH